MLLERKETRRLLLRNSQTGLPSGGRTPRVKKFCDFCGVNPAHSQHAGTWAIHIRTGPYLEEGPSPPPGEPPLCAGAIRLVMAQSDLFAFLDLFFLLTFSACFFSKKLKKKLTNQAGSSLNTGFSS